MKKGKKTILYVIVVALAAVVIVGVVWVKNYRSAAVDRDVVVFVPTGADYARLTDSLEASGAFVNPERFDKYARLKSLDKGVRPGRYKITRGASYGSVVNMLLNGYQEPVKLTFNNIRTFDRLAKVVSGYIEADSTHLMHLFSSDSVAAANGFDSNTFIAMFIPNTYEFYWTTDGEGFIARMKKEYEKFWSGRRDEEAAAIGLSRVQAVTLASIVNEESKKADELARVAGVYMNRLRIGMKLQADPTVKFAVGDFTIKRVLDRHTAVVSPYNTYQVYGLPPGPICIPPINVVDAVLGYEKHDYIYFCASDDLSGYHKFARTLSEHNVNADRYRRKISSLGIR